MELIENNQQLIKKLQGSYSDTNAFALPRVKSVTVNIGTGKIKDDKETLEKVFNLIKLITGQCPQAIKAKKSIAAFKVREGQAIGYKVTLRHKKAYDFLNKLFHVAIPRIRDFRGLKESSINGSSFNLGIIDNIVFPESDYGKGEVNQSLQITVSLTKSDKVPTRSVIELLGGKFSNQ